MGDIEIGTLALGEPHPMAHSALEYVVNNATASIEGALSSCALSGNRLAEVCSETLRRVKYREPVSDRYILGLAWYLKTLEEMDDGK